MVPDVPHFFENLSMLDQLRWPCCAEHESRIPSGYPTKSRVGAVCHFSSQSALENAACSL